MAKRARFITPFERIVYLRSLNLMGQLDMASLVGLAEAAGEAMFSAGEDLIRADEPVLGAFVLISGSVDEYRGGKHAGTWTAPTWAGMIGLQARLQSGLRLTAKTDVVALEVDRDGLAEVLSNDPQLLAQIITFMAGMLLDSTDGLPADPANPPDAPLGDLPGDELGIVGRLSFLSEAGLFRGANLDALIPLARGLRQLRFEPGEPMWEIGDPASAGHYLRYGRVRTIREDGVEVTVGAGHGVGLVDALANRPRRYRAVAETVVVAYEISSEALLGTAAQHPELGRRVIQGFAGEVFRSTSG